MIPKIVLVLVLSFNIFASANDINIETNKINNNCEHQQFKCIYQCEDGDENTPMESCYKNCDKKYLSWIETNI